MLLASLWCILLYYRIIASQDLIVWLSIIVMGVVWSAIRHYSQYKWYHNIINVCCELIILWIVLSDISSLVSLYHPFSLAYLHIFSSHRYLLPPIMRWCVWWCILLYVGELWIQNHRSSILTLQWRLINLISIIWTIGIIWYWYLPISYISWVEWQHNGILHDQTIIEWQWQTGDVIMIFLESFSFDNSRLVGWSNPMLSWFDTIAAQGTYFASMISNGCSSDAWHIATLAWAWPRHSSLDDWWYYHNHSTPYPWLAHVFNRHWYDTIFISTAPLSFLNQRDFLVKNWFNTLIDYNHFSWSTLYGWFKTAPDADLYQNIIDTLDTWSWVHQFIVGQTMSTHLPYDTPYWSTKEQARNYADDALKQFYDTLVDKGFFEQWILVLISDHRKFDPLTQWELQQRWQTAHGKIIWAIIWNNITPQIFSGPIQHIDIYHTLAHRFSSWSTISSIYYNNPLTQTIQRDRTIRYCPFVDNQLHITTPSWSYYQHDPWLPQNISQIINNHIWTNHLSGESWSRRHKAQRLFSSQQSTPSKPPIQLVGHRGGSASGQNTIQWIRSVAWWWVRAIEIDVARTKDNILLLTNGHTSNIKCSIPLSGFINQYSWSFLINHCTDKDGDPLHTIYEVLTKIAWLFDTIFLEVKLSDTESEQHIRIVVDTLQDAIVSTRTTNVVSVISYHSGLMKLLHDEYPALSLWQDSYTSDDVFSIQDTRFNYFLTEKSTYRQQHISHAHRHNIPFVVYTISSKEELYQAIAYWADMALVSDIAQAQQRLRERKP